MATTDGLPEAGKTAPAFTGTTEANEKIRLSQFKGKYVVLYFYPKDNTPGCTVEAKEFRDEQDDFEGANAVVIGISPDDAESHLKFITRFELNFSLVADENHKIAEKYGVWAEKSMYGKKYMGVQRTTFLIDPKGKIAHVWPKVRAEGHADQVLKVLAEITG
jgi:thioredoxin-dependent peroxiredoxin